MTEKELMELARLATEESPSEPVKRKPPKKDNRVDPRVWLDEIGIKPGRCQVNARAIWTAYREMYPNRAVTKVKFFLVINMLLPTRATSTGPRIKRTTKTIYYLNLKAYEIDQKNRQLKALKDEQENKT